MWKCCVGKRRKHKNWPNTCLSHLLLPFMKILHEHFILTCKMLFSTWKWIQVNDNPSIQNEKELILRLASVCFSIVIVKQIGSLPIKSWLGAPFNFRLYILMMNVFPTSTNEFVEEVFFYEFKHHSWHLVGTIYDPQTWHHHWYVGSNIVIFLQLKAFTYILKRGYN